MKKILLFAALTTFATSGLNAAENQTSVPEDLECNVVSSVDIADSVSIVHFATGFALVRLNRIESDIDVETGYTLVSRNFEKAQYEYTADNVLLKIEKLRVCTRTGCHIEKKGTLLFQGQIAALECEAVTVD
jgi:hypothetical protein